MTRQANLYRVPQKPGYLGGYNWRATLSGLSLLVIVSALATQFMAKAFNYQSALGAPFTHVGRMSIYQPFAG